jgi:Methyltransferase domain
MKLHRLRSYEEYEIHLQKSKGEIVKHQEFLSRYTPNRRVSFKVPGYSYTAGRQVDFEVDFQHAGESGPVNWRERVACPITYFNNRMRATFHLYDIEMAPYSDANIYITEQVTPIFKYFEQRYENVTGSEYMGERIPFGTLDKNGVRNENLCALTFRDESFDTLISLDVLEHIPTYEQAFAECVRVLKPGGRMLWSVPFIASSKKNFIRARIVNGEVVHDHPPEYHGDPMSKDGVLCFQHFGWEMLDQLREAGLSDAYAVCFHSVEFGYLGGEQFIFVGIK